MYNVLTETTAPMGGSWISLVGIAVMFVILYFVMIRPQKKQEKQVNEMRNNLVVGDEITTIGGIIGTVVNVKDEKIVIETGADQVRIELAKWGISTNETAAEAAQAASKKAQEEKAKAKAAKKAGK